MRRARRRPRPARRQYRGAYFDHTMEDHSWDNGRAYQDEEDREADLFPTADMLSKSRLR